MSSYKYLITTVQFLWPTQYHAEPLQQNAAFQNLLGEANEILMVRIHVGQLDIN